MAASYRLAISGAISARIRKLYGVARDQGRGAEFRAAIAQGLSKLEDDPLGFGEPSFRYKHLDLLNYVVIEPPLAIEYCVDEARKIVYLKLLTLQDPPPG